MSFFFAPLLPPLSCLNSPFLPHDLVLDHTVKISFSPPVRLDIEKQLMLPSVGGILYRFDCLHVVLPQ